VESQLAEVESRGKGDHVRTWEFNKQSGE